MTNGCHNDGLSDPSWFTPLLLDVLFVQIGDTLLYTFFVQHSPYTIIDHSRPRKFHDIVCENGNSALEFVKLCTKFAQNTAALYFFWNMRILLKRSFIEICLNILFCQSCLSYLHR